MADPQISGIVSTDILRERINEACSKIWAMSSSDNKPPEFDKLTIELKSYLYSILIQANIGQASYAGVIKMLGSLFENKSEGERLLLVHTLLTVHARVVKEELTNPNFNSQLVDEMVKSLCVKEEKVDA